MEQPGRFFVTPAWPCQQFARAVFAVAVFGLLPCAQAEEKKGGAPAITAVAPLELAAGATTALHVRGLNLETVSELRFLGAGAGIQAEIKEKKKADIPNGLEAKDVGDTQVEASIAMPAEMPIGRVRFVVITHEGASPPHEILIVEPARFIEEKEPNNGFHEAQSIELGKTVRGAINQDKDVDVYKFDGRAGQKIHAEILASRLGSLLDGVLTLFDARGQVVALCDDTAESRDPVVDLELPRDGVYYAAVQDAQDRGGSWHCYELTITQPK